MWVISCVQSSIESNRSRMIHLKRGALVSTSKLPVASGGTTKSQPSAANISVGAKKVYMSAAIVSFKRQLCISRLFLDAESELTSRGGVTYYIGSHCLPFGCHDSRNPTSPADLGFNLYWSQKGRGLPEFASAPTRASFSDR